MLVARRDPIPRSMGRSIWPQPQAPARTRAVVPAADDSARCSAFRSRWPAPIRSTTPISRPRRSARACARNIVAMLDKSADASTRAHAGAPRRRGFRAELRRGRSRRGGGVQALLTAEGCAARRPPRPRPPPVKNAASEPAHRPEPVKQPAAKPAVAESEPARHGAEVSDANWLAAVRGALVTHDPVPPRAEPDRSRPCRPCTQPCRRSPRRLKPAARRSISRRPRRNWRPCRPPRRCRRRPRLPPRRRQRRIAVIRCRRARFPKRRRASEATAQAEPRSRWRALLTHVPGFNRVMEPD